MAPKSTKNRSKIDLKAHQKHVQKKEPKREARERPSKLRLGGVAPYKQIKPPYQGVPVDILTLHFVPWGHGGGYQDFPSSAWIPRVPRGT